MLALRQFRKKTQALPDLLNLAALVDDGIVLTKSGALIGGFYFRGRDLTSSTAAERNNVVSRINAGLSRLGSGWVAWIDAMRIPAAAYSPPGASSFGDLVSHWIDSERRKHFMAEGAHYESEYVLLLMFEPPKRKEQKIKELVYDDDFVTEASAHNPGPKIIEQFNHVLRDMEDFFGDVLRLRRMRSHLVTIDSRVSDQQVLRDDLVTYLHYCITGRVDPINIPPCPMYLDGYIGAVEAWAGDTPKIGEHFVAAITLEGFPQETMPNMLDALDHLPMAYRWSTRFIFLDQHEATGHLSKFRRKWKQKEKGFWSQVFRTKSGIINEDAAMMTRTAEKASHDASSGLVTFGFYTSVIILNARTRAQLEEQVRLVTREVRRMGFAARHETVNTMECWLGSIAGHPMANVRRPMMHTLNLADLLPLASVWPGAHYNPSPLYREKSPPLLHAATSGATPFRLNLHVSDVGHTLIFGPTGAGKSTLLALIAAQFRRYPKSSIVAFDKGRSLFPLVSAIPSGHHYELAGENDRTGLCPLQFLETQHDAAWAEEWLATCYQLQSRNGVPPTPRQREEIHRAIRLMKESEHGRSLTDFLATVQDNELRDALKHYTLDGNLGSLLDARRDGLASSDFMVFEIEDLLQLGDKNALPVLLYLFRRFEKSLTGQPALLILDEAWVMLGHPVFREKIREWLKVLRKSNCAVVLATQSLSDATKSGIFDVLIENCPTKILLPNDDADKKGTAEHPGPLDLYTMMGLNETEIRILRTSQKKKHYYYTSSEGRRLFDLAMGPLALAFCGASDKDSLRRIRELIAQHGREWTVHWLRERGVTYDQVA